MVVNFESIVVEVPWPRFFRVPDLRATIRKNLIFNFHPEIDFADNSFIDFFWQEGNKYEIRSEKFNFL